MFQSFHSEGKWKRVSWKCTILRFQYFKIYIVKCVLYLNQQTHVRCILKTFIYFVKMLYLLITHICIVKIKLSQEINLSNLVDLLCIFERKNVQRNCRKLKRKFDKLLMEVSE